MMIFQINKPQRNPVWGILRKKGPFLYPRYVEIHKGKVLKFYTLSSSGEPNDQYSK